MVEPEITPPPTTAGWPRRWRLFGIWLATVLGISLLMFTYHHLAVVAEGGKRPAIAAALNELSAVFGAGVLFWGVRALVRAWPLTARRATRIPLYLAVLALYSVVHTSSNWALRALLYPMAGLGKFDYGIMPVRYLMELPIDVISFVVMVGALHWVRAGRRARARELRAAHLERSLTESKLANLRLQLQPHFLFNALNTISATMYRDVDEADALIERLGALLRGSLSTSRDELVPLGQELDWLGAYIALLEARFEDRLTVELDVDDGVRAALVPSMVLQPLVENAVRHGGVEGRGHGLIRIAARREGSRLALSVEDDGPGAPTPIDPEEAGFGLRSIAERLALIYGRDGGDDGNDGDDGHALVLCSGSAGGFTARVRVPYQVGAGPVQASEGRS
ncbi:sensor histidine kinase [Haliangium sp.]|uniref:sensor histidine kinase n=1 Tax=Haliangium sp. TaxID=2663208 RepID=UPI003D0985EF